MPLPSLLERHRATLRELGLAVFAVLFVCLSVHLFTPSFIENDDVTIADYAMQGFAVRYMGIFLTGLMHLGYSWRPELAWYGLILYTCHFLSVYLWLSLTFRVFRPWWLGAPCALLFLGFYLVFLVYLDYTSTCVMLCCVSLTWAYLDVMQRRVGWLRYLGLGLVFLLGMMARPQGAPGAILYTLPIGLLAAWVCLREQPWRVELKRLALVAVLFLAPAAIGFVLDQAWRQSSATPQQVQYDRFNDIRGKLHSINRGRKRHIMADKRLLSQVHWTRRDAAFFFNWNFLDERVYTPEVLRTVLDAAPPPRVTAGHVLSILRGRAGNALFLLSLASWPLLLLFAYRQRLLGGAALLLPLYSVAVTSFMFLTFAFTYRVELPFEVGFGFSSLLLAGALLAREVSLSAMARLRALLVALIVAGYGLVQILSHQYHSYQSERLAADRAQQMLDTLNRDFAGSVILVEPKAGLPLERLSPLQVVHLDFTPIQLGWSTFSPRFYQQIGRLGIQHGYELVDALITHDKAYLLGSKAWCNNLLPYASVTDPTQVQPVLVERLTPGVSVYRFERQK